MKLALYYVVLCSVYVAIQYVLIGIYLLVLYLYIILLSNGVIRFIKFSVPSDETPSKKRESSNRMCQVPNTLLNMILIWYDLIILVQIRYLQSKTKETCILLLTFRA